MVDKLPPHNRDAEQVLLGAIMRWPEDYQRVEIEADDFYIRVHRWIWDAFGEIIRSGQQIDGLTLQNYLENIGKLEECGGGKYIGELLGSVPFGHDPEDSAAIIRDYSQRRGLENLAMEMGRAANDTEVDINSLLPGFVERLVNASRVSGSATHWKKYINDLCDEISERMNNPKEIWGIPTGFKVFDRVTGGLQRGELMILSGKPGVGKTMLATQMAQQMSAYEPGAIYSLEMGGISVVRRVVSAEALVQTRKLKTGKIEEAEYPLIAHAVEKIEVLPIYMSDATGWTTTSLRADLSRLKLQHGVSWFVFDYMLLANDAPDKDEIERTAIISRNMKLITRYLDIAGIAIHSMNKEGIRASVPQQQALRGNAQTAYDADLICFLTDFQAMNLDDNAIRKDDRENMRTLIFGKGRELEDPRKYIHMVKRPGLPAFADYQPAYGNNGHYH